MTFKIDKGIPIPPDNQKMTKYPWREMEVGDSFFMPVEPSKSRNKVASGLLTTARFYKPLKFKTAQNSNGVRVWRIK